MTFPLDDILLGPATFGGLHRVDLFIGHTGEEPGFERKYAVATANYQLTNPGSYNFRIYDRRSDPRGVMLNVPWMEASGGINPLSTAWAPDRYPWIREQLAKAGPCPKAGCPGPYRNPTMHAIQGSFVGKTADLNAGKAPPNYEPDAKALIAWTDKHPLRGSAPLVVVMHGHLQTNRSDWGAYMQARLTAAEEDMPLVNFTPIVNRRAIIAKGAAARIQPAFDRNDYDAGLIATEPNQRTRTAVAWVDGTNLTLSDGTVYDARKRWLLTDSDSHGAIFYHERDVVDFQAIETVQTGKTQADVDAAVGAALAAFNKNLDVWTGQRPRS